MMEYTTLEIMYLWKLLDLASGIDLKETPTQYLHGKEDIQLWIKKYDNT
jgi:hypothetical protein